MKDTSLDEFTRQTASGEPVPGGGSVAALAGSLAAALAEMVANLTAGRSELEGVGEKAAELREKLLDAIEEDSLAFKEVMDAYRMPKETPGQRDLRKARIQESLRYAAEVPMNTAELSYSIMELSAKTVEYGNQNAVTDGMVSAMMARTAVLSALLNVRINLSSIKDREYTKRMAIRADELETACRRQEDEIIKGITF